MSDDVKRVLTDPENQPHQWARAWVREDTRSELAKAAKGGYYIPPEDYEGYASECWRAVNEAEYLLSTVEAERDRLAGELGEAREAKDRCEEWSMKHQTRALLAEAELAEARENDRLCQEYLEEAIAAIDDRDKKLAEARELLDGWRVAWLLTVKTAPPLLERTYNFLARTTATGDAGEGRE